jgi:hypothetical protein
MISATTTALKAWALREKEIQNVRAHQWIAKSPDGRMRLTKNNSAASPPDLPKA